jgi:hypothetical protein
MPLHVLARRCISMTFEALGLLCLLGGEKQALIVPYIRFQYCGVIMSLVNINL